MNGLQAICFVCTIAVRQNMCVVFNVEKNKLLKITVSMIILIILCLLINIELIVFELLQITITP